MGVAAPCALMGGWVGGGDMSAGSPRDTAAGSLPAAKLGARAAPAVGCWLSLTGELLIAWSGTALPVPPRSPRAGHFTGTGHQTAARCWGGGTKTHATLSGVGDYHAEEGFFPHFFRPSQQSTCSLAQAELCRALFPAQPRPRHHRDWPRWEQTPLPTPVPALLISPGRKDTIQQKSSAWERGQHPRCRWLGGETEACRATPAVLPRGDQAGPRGGKFQPAAKLPSSASITAGAVVATAPSSGPFLGDVGES